jgi:flagellar hook-basal body complex protein FliE
MTIPPISGIGAASSISPAGGAAAPGSVGGDFGNSIKSALEAVSEAEFEANVLAEDVAMGGETSVQDLMVAMTKASLSVDLLIQVRNRAVEAYQEIMRMQI